MPISKKPLGYLIAILLFFFLSFSPKSEANETCRLWCIIVIESHTLHNCESRTGVRAPYGSGFNSEWNSVLYDFRRNVIIDPYDWLHYEWDIVFSGLGIK